ncbi:hypothetical protein N7451_012062 [Penicillium sp. IBT 35674x]|nr:hypothetical protein N7451_012062 [Penicillium sp. IBT 35674x]
MEVKFYVQPYLLDVEENHFCQTILSCLDIISGTGLAVVLRNSKLEFLIGSGGKIEAFKGHSVINQWRWLQIWISLVGHTFSANIRQLNRLAEMAPGQETITRNMSIPMVLGANAIMFGAGGTIAAQYDFH